MSEIPDFSDVEDYHPEPTTLTPEKRIAQAKARAQLARMSAAHAHGRKSVAELTTADVGSWIAIGFWLAVGSFLFGCIVCVLSFIVATIFGLSIFGASPAGAV